MSRNLSTRVAVCTPRQNRSRTRRRPVLEQLERRTLLSAGDILWARQFGTGQYGWADSVAAKDGSIYVTGYTYGALPGQTNAGATDSYVRKYTSDGTELWTRQFGASGVDYGVSVATDDTGVYVIGYTYGALQGQTSSGGYDAYLRKYSFDGAELWTHQFNLGSSETLANGLAVDATGVYVVGSNGGDGFVRKYAADGAVLWTREFSAGAAFGVAADATGIYIDGNSSAGGYVCKYTTDGSELWTRQFGSGAGVFVFGRGGRRHWGLRIRLALRHPARADQLGRHGRVPLQVRG